MRNDPKLIAVLLAALLASSAHAQSTTPTASTATDADAAVAVPVVAAAPAMNPGSGKIAAALTNVAPPQQDVLQMRASGMGWGEIAHSFGLKLGPLVSNRPAVVTATGSATDLPLGGSASPTPAPVREPITAYGGQGRSSGIVTAAGSSVSPTMGFGRAGSTPGVVSAHGGGAGSAHAAVGHGKGKH